MANVAPPRGMTRAESKEFNRRRLIDAARRLLIQRGYNGLSARQVSARAGVAQSSFYAHFRDKEDLVRTLADEIFSRLRRQLRETRLVTQAQGWEAMVHQTWMRLYDFFGQERELIALLFQEMDQPRSPLNEIGQEIFDTLHRDFSEDLQTLIGEGHVPPLPVEAMGYLIIGTSAWVIRRLLSGRLPDPLALLSQMDLLNRALIRGLAGGAEG